MKIDLDVLERKARAVTEGAFSTVMDGPIVIALVARIRELEDSLASALDLDDHGAMLSADRDEIRALLARGVTLP